MVAMVNVLILCILASVQCQIQPRSRSDVIVLGKSCVQEVEDYRQCLDQVREDIDRRYNDTARIGVRDRIHKCFLENGCHDPSLETLVDGISRKEHEKCMQTASAEARTILHECVQRFVPDFPLVEDLPWLEDDVNEMAKSEFPSRGPWGLRNREKPGLLRLAVQTLTYIKNYRICDVTANSSGLQTCLGRAFRDVTAGDTPFDQVMEAEQKFNFYCSGRDRCRQWMTETCQKYLDDGKTASCRCAKLDLFTKSAHLSSIYNHCVDKDTIHVAAPKIVDDLVRAYCIPSRDPCIENFPPRYQLNIFIK